MRSWTASSATPPYKRVWEGLAGLVQKAKRHLIITLGNHDIELALPWVQERLLDLLSGGDEAARGRITLSFSGAGYVCGVGGASVLCVHGNDFDPFNFTDYEKLRAIGVDYVQRRPLEAWTPNAGTKLVIDVMNQVKQTFPFVDLLKPVATSMLPILAELAPDLKAKLEAERVKVKRIRPAGGRLGHRPPDRGSAAGADERTAAAWKPSPNQKQGGCPGAHQSRRFRYFPSFNHPES